MRNAITDHLRAESANAIAYAPIISIDLAKNPRVPPYIEQQQEIDSGKCLAGPKFPTISIVSAVRILLNGICSCDGFGQRVRRYWWYAETDVEYPDADLFMITGSTHLAIGYDQSAHINLSRLLPGRAIEFKY